MKRLPLSAGEKDQLVTVQRRAAGTDARGQPNGAWQTLHANLWAKVAPLRTRELLAAAQVQTPVDTLVAIDYVAGLLPSDRLLWGTQPLEIVGAPIDVDGQQHTLEIQCLQGERDGR